MYYESDELEHHGILGQKWGVRRYQNADGTLTEEGKKKYSEDAYEVKILKSKNTNNLSNDELEILNQRLKLEQEYKSYTSKGESYTKKFLAEAGGKVVGTALTASAIYLGTKYATNVMKTELKNVTMEMASKVSKEALASAAKTASAAVKTNVQTNVKEVAKTNVNVKKSMQALNKYGKTVDKILKR
jgi:hypothetical protein